MTQDHEDGFQGGSTTCNSCVIVGGSFGQVKPMLFPEFWAPIGGFAGRQLPPSLRLERLEFQVQTGMAFARDLQIFCLLTVNDMTGYAIYIYT